jgi:excisionase family DNA binding protein
MTDRPLPPGPLFTPRAAAERLGMSVKTLMAHVADGDIRYIRIGKGKRVHHRFTSYNLATFLEKQKVKESPPSPSLSVPALKHTATTSKSGAVGFLAIPRPETKKLPKPSNAA